VITIGIRAAPKVVTFAVYDSTSRTVINVEEIKNPSSILPAGSTEVRAGRPHLVTNAGKTSATFLVLQGIGEYDFVPLV